MKTFKGALALLLLVVFFLCTMASIFIQTADARADYVTWADRVLRPTAPCGCTGPCTCVQCIVSWPGVKGVGNLGIGNGNASLVQPEFINDAVADFQNSMAGNESKGDNSAGVVPAPENLPAEKGMLASRDTATGSCPSCYAGGEKPVEVQESKASTESLLPDYLMSAGIITRTEPYSILYGKPLPHILNENPVEPGVIYGKMYGITMPDGRVIDIGVKSLGSEY